MKLAFLGLGKMGAAMARKLMAAGHEVTVWNRDSAKAQALTSEGAKAAAAIAEAVQGKDAIVSMLFDDAANEKVLLTEDGALAAMDQGALHIACSTISVSLSDRLTSEHASRGQQYVAAPVFGRPNIAAEGKLWIVAAGPADAIAKARPVLEPMSRGITIIGPKPSQAHALKLAGNFTISLMIQALSEAAVFGQANGIDPALLLETINSALFQSPFYAAYSKLMLNPPEPPGGTIELGQKDLNLLLTAAHAQQVKLSIAEQMETRFTEAVASGLGNTDWAAGLLKAAEQAAHQ